ncbi:MAG: hypothetical protein E7342_01300 [Clostridiales bacterium]|nr:hypothetical protein [Clostridiales bacterium]
MDKFSLFKLLNSFSSLLQQPQTEEKPIQKKEPPKNSSFSKAYINTVSAHKAFVERVKNRENKN